MWLEEMQLNKFNPQNILLPPQFDVPRLLQLFRGNIGHWTEFIPLKEIREMQKRAQNSWLASNFRYVPNKSLGKVNESSLVEVDVVQRIFERLQQYVSPKEAPKLLKLKPVMGKIDIGKSTIYLLRTEYKILDSFAR